MTDRELMQQALGALESKYIVNCGAWRVQQDQAITALRERLAQPEQEPVAWQVMVEDEAMKEFSIKDMAHDWCVRQKLSGSSYAYWIRPLYTTPPQRKPLTDEEIEEVFFDMGQFAKIDLKAFARAIEAAHGIGEKPDAA